MTQTAKDPSPFSVPVSKFQQSFLLTKTRGGSKFSSAIFLLPPSLPTLYEPKLKLGFGPSLNGARGYTSFSFKKLAFTPPSQGTLLSSIISQ